MATLTNTKIKDTYDGLLKTTDNEALDVSGVTLIEDGLGNASALSVGRSGNGVTITGSLNATLATAAQPNITSVGTLSSLSVSGNLAVDTNTLYVDAANNRVGIGRTPTNLLDLASGMTVQQAQDIKWQNTARDTTYGAINSSASALTFKWAGSETMRIDASGRVGIGKIPSSESLEVSGNINTTGSLTAGSALICTNGALTIDSGASSQYATFDTDATNGGYMSFLKAGTTLADIGNAGQIVSGGSANDFGINVRPSNNLIFGTANQERMRIDSSGNVGIGTSSPSSLMHIRGAAATLTLGDSTQSSSSVSTILFKNSDGNGANREIVKIKGLTGANGGYGNIVFETAFNNTLSERMRITSGGQVLFGTTSAPNGSTSFGVGLVPSTNDRMSIRAATSTTSAAGLVFFYNPNGVVGSIQTSGSSTSYVTSSDYRLKENVVEMTGALDRVDALKPSRFNFIADPNKTVDGFLAHEVAEVIPEAISGEKDAVDEEGNPVYQGIDQSKIVPLLVGAIKELRAEIELLKSQLS